MSDGPQRAANRPRLAPKSPLPLCMAFTCDLPNQYSVTVQAVGGVVFDSRCREPEWKVGVPRVAQPIFIHKAIGNKESHPPLCEEELGLHTK